MSYETWMMMQGFDTQDDEFYEAMRDAWKAGHAEGSAPGPTTLYLAVCDDHHCDLTIMVFRTEDAARAQCDAWLADLPEYTKPHEENTVSGWLYSVRYGDGNWVRVEAHELEETEANDGN